MNYSEYILSFPKLILLDPDPIRIQIYERQFENIPSTDPDWKP